MKDPARNGCGRGYAPRPIDICAPSLLSLLAREPQNVLNSAAFRLGVRHAESPHSVSALVALAAFGSRER